MKPQVKTIIADILAWYDKNGRDLPWRVKGAAHSDPYKVWLSEIMLQQTTVPAVAPYYAKFTTKYPTVHALAKAPTEDVMSDWAGLGYYSRARNLHACAKMVSNDFHGKFPSDMAELKELPGIGDYTAGAIAAIAFGKQAVVVDGNIERVITRLYAIETPFPLSKPEIKEIAHKFYHNEANTRPHDLPQALMDFANAICTPKNPKCVICPIQKQCVAFKAGIQNELPKRVVKKARPKRNGFVYWITDNKGRVLTQRRPDKGLLGGMIGLPTSDWSDDPAHLKDFKIEKIEKKTVKHVFTHFELTLTIVRASVKKPPADHTYIDPQDGGFPSVFAKVVNLLKA